VKPKLSLARQRVLDAVMEHHGSNKRAADALGISHKTVEEQMLSIRRLNGDRSRLITLMRWYAFREHGIEPPYELEVEPRRGAPSLVSRGLQPLQPKYARPS
jgi:DNA-binding CsgD family transcriptional regulator